MASVAGVRDPIADPRRQLLGYLGQLFPRIAVFRLQGTYAQLESVHGEIEHPGTLQLSLVDRTPLRSAIEAASPIVGSGRESGGRALSRLLRLSPARTFVIVPLVADRKIAALVYADRVNKTLPLAQTAQLFALCARQLNPAPRPPARAVTSNRNRRPYAPRIHHPRQRRRIGHDDSKFFDVASDVKPDVAIDDLHDVTAETESLPDIAFDIAAEDPHEVMVAPHTETSPDIAIDFARDVLNDIKRDTWLELAPEDASTGPALEVVAEPPPDAQAPPPARAPETSRPTAEPRWTTPAEAEPADAPPSVVITPHGVVDASSEMPSPRTGYASRVLVSFATIVLIAIAGVGLWTVSPPRSGEGSAVLRIHEGDSFGNIADSLERAGIVRSSLAFKAIAQFQGADRKLRAGTYRLSREAFAWDIVRELRRGQVNLRSVTIPEGLALPAIAEQVANAGLSSRDAFIQAATDPVLLQELGVQASSAEGYLFPETYRLAKGLSAEEIVTLMVRQFFETREMIPQLAVLSGDELHRRIILASLVEREVKDPREMAKVAGVFTNRLARSMRLESCATVQYILGEPKARLTLDDVRIQHPYNTYLREGLPPGPIASPGRDALRAAANPTDHEFLFFVAREDGTGEHAFARTYEEHQKNQQRSRRGG